MSSIEKFKTVQELAKEKLAISRKKGRKSQLQKLRKTQMYLETALDIVLDETNPCSLMLEAPSKGYLPNRLPRWRNLSLEQKVYAAHRHTIIDSNLTVLAFSINFSPSSAVRIKNSPKLDYPRDELSKALRKALPKLESVYFWFGTENERKGKRIHIHGVVAIPNKLFNPTTCKALEDAIATLPMCRKYKVIGSNKIADVKNTYMDKNGLEKPIDIDWAHYIEGKRYAISQDLRGMIEKSWPPTI